MIQVAGQDISKHGTKGLLLKSSVLEFKHLDFIALHTLYSGMIHCLRIANSKGFICIWKGTKVLLPRANLGRILYS